MDLDQLGLLATEALSLALLLSAPVLGASLGAGLIMGMLQTATQVQDHSLTFVPKVAAVGAALLLGGAWMGSELLSFTETLWATLP
ncbi:MAG: flagellar biosynthetic protein FliQ [Myxococcota bacterium]